MSWDTMSWNDIVEIRNGKSQKEVLSDDGKYPIIGSSGKHIGYAKEYLSEANSTIIGRKGTINNPILIKDDYWNVDTAFGLHSKDGLHYKFLFYFCKSFDFTKLDKGSGRPSLVKSDLLKIKMPVPKISEQKQIVETLDKAFKKIDKAIANIERNIENAEELFNSYLQNAFEKKGNDWEEKKIIEICRLINGKAYKKKELLNEGKYRVLRVGNLFTNKHWYHSDLELAEDKYIDKGDLIYAWSASFGPRIWTEEKVIYHYHIWKVIPDNKLVTKEFLHLLFEWDKEKIKKAQGTGTTMIHVGKGSMEDREILLPPLNQQKQIVKNLNYLKTETKKLEAFYTQKIADLEEMKKSILEKAFKGELTCAA